MNRIHLLRFCVLCIGESVLCTSVSAAQQVSEFAIGAAQVGAFSGKDGATYAYGLGLRGSIGSVVVRHVQLRGDLSGIAFGRPEEEIVSCTSTGHCASNWGKTLGGILGLSGSGHFDLDSRGRFYASLGVGAYEEFLDRNSSHAGYSGGIGAVLPASGRRIAIEADWLQLSGGGAVATRALPISAVFRF